MIRTVTAFYRPDTLEAVCSMLERSGIPVRFRCRTGAEAIRAVKKMGGGVVICAYKLPDMTADELAFELRGEAMVLVVAKPAQLDLCEAADIFKIPAPVRTGELCGSVNMLLQLSEQRSRIPRRSSEEAELVSRAKELLMSRNSMTEEEAHRFLQRRSMETSSKMADTARLILASAD